MQDQAMTDQVNWQNIHRENPPVHSMAERLRDFTRMNPLIFTRSKLRRMPKSLWMRCIRYWFLGAPDTEKEELASYLLKDIAQTWCKIWQDSRVLGRVPITLLLFKTTFLERLFPREMREAKVEEFINLKQGSITIREYSLKFFKLSTYDTSLVSNRRD